MAPMGGAKTIYVREADADVWQRAEAYAKVRRLSMSALIMAALEQYLFSSNLAMRNAAKIDALVAAVRVVPAVDAEGLAEELARIDALAGEEG